MNYIPRLSLFLMAWLLIFGATQFRPVQGIFGTPLNWVPSLLVYAALTHSIGWVVGFGIFCAFGLDGLSANPIGTSLMPLVVTGGFIQLRQHLLLRDQAYAQFWLGFGAGFFFVAGSLGMLLLTGHDPLHSNSTWIQCLVTSCLNGLACPLWFGLFDRLRRIFDYQPLPHIPFRPDRQIKYGKSYTR